jgi:hypothetical protein
LLLIYDKLVCNNTEAAELLTGNERERRRERERGDQKDAVACVRPRLSNIGKSASTTTCWKRKPSMPSKKPSTSLRLDLSSAKRRRGREKIGQKRKRKKST